MRSAHPYPFAKILIIIAMSQSNDTLQTPSDSIVVTVDSVVAADSAAHVALPWELSVCREEEAPSSASEREACRSLETTYLSGLPAEPRQPRAATDSGILTLLTVMFLFVAFNFKHCAKLFGVLAADMWSVRRRANAFDDPTANETRVLVVLLFQLWVCEGLLTYAALSGLGYIAAPASIFKPIVALSGVAFVYYLSQLAAYRFVGYLFTDPIGASQWVKGFNSSQAFLGIALMIPALVTVFYPSATDAMLWAASGLYVVARILFIIKGFRIFYHNFPSLLYFILYLCALELVPLVLLVSTVTYLSMFLS